MQTRRVQKLFQEQCSLLKVFGTRFFQQRWRTQPACADVLKAPQQFGQAAGATHPWALGTDEVAPGVTFSELASRRDALAALLPTGAVCVLPSAPQQFRVGAIPHPYRQSSDFLYFTGLHYTLLKTPQPLLREIWDGPVMSLDVVTGVFGADEAQPLSDGSLRACLEQRLTANSTAGSMLFMDRDRPCPELAYALRHVITDPDPRRRGGWSTVETVQETAGGNKCLQVQPLRPLLHKLRWRKSPAEVAAMRRTVRAGTAAMRACIEATEPGIGEHALSSLYEFHVKARGGATALAFPPVVGTGANACIVHYRHADSMLRDGELILMDAGAEVWGACSDVTRTWPVNGRFTQAQRIVHEHVAEIHRACLARCRAGETLAGIHALSVRMLQTALVDLGVRLQPHEYRQVYPHSVGHWLGWDTHDVSSVGQQTPLQPGVVLTIEPGLYLPASHPAVPREFANIGVRIEDDVLITEHGCEVLSDHETLPIDAVQLESLVGTKRGMWGDSLPKIAVS